MPIKVTCACGQSFAAKDELAGRTVQCPKCGRPLTIPAATAASPSMAATQPMPLPAAPATPAGGGAPTRPPTSVFDEVGLKAAPVGTRPCPGCAAPMLPNAILCLQCGYNLQLGRRMETMRVGPSGEGPTTHGEVVSSILNRAAQSIEEEKEEEKKKVREGLPWWAYLLMLIGVVSFMVGMMLVPQGHAVLVAGWMIAGVGGLLGFYAWLRVLIIAFYEHPLHGVLCLLCGPYIIYILVIKWDECSGYFFIWLGGQALLLLGMGIIFLAGLFQDDTPVGNLWLAREVLAHLPLLHPLVWGAVR
jgi:hypothetical protein